MCEGETESEYFAAARVRYGLTTAEVVLAENTEGSAPTSVVKCAEKRSAEPGSYDKIFCVFDRDGHQSYVQAREKIKALAGRRNKPLPIAEAISVPCFEAWVLLHFERTDAAFGSCDDVTRRIRERHMTNYQKADAETAGRLMNNVDAAIANADWLEQRAAHNNYNPYTSVHHVLRHFESVAAQEAVS
ncbi:MAG: RloB domain-containing protein [Gammaproteobacteria bacterium]|nr:RloB domain-containing protein [Gammaproteobacteria bacterium]